MATGWRLWGIDRRGRMVAPSHLTANIEWKTGWNAADCRRAPHAAPADDCRCGIHVCPTRKSLDVFLLGRTWPNLVMGEVEYAGSVLPSWTAVDPVGTVRVERARLLRLDITSLYSEKQSAVASALRERYGVPVIDQELCDLYLALHGRPMRT